MEETAAAAPDLLSVAGQEVACADLKPLIAKGC
jgi:hypothetical protein